MPAYHLARADGQGGVSIVNIGVGPSNPNFLLLITIKPLK
jgi:hypothetical protein